MNSKLLFLVFLAYCFVGVLSKSSRILTTEAEQTIEDLGQYAPHYELSEEYLRAIGDIEYQFSGHRGVSMYDMRPQVLEAEEEAAAVDAAIAQAEARYSTEPAASTETKTEESQAEQVVVKQGN